MDMHPPKYALKFLRWFCREDYLEEIEGNLIEVYEKHYAQSSQTANRQFTWNVLRHFRPAFIRSFKISYSHNNTPMFSNYLKIGWRNLVKYKMYSAIKIGGLALGIAACLLIALFIQQELSYDRHYKHGNRIFRVVQSGTFYGNNFKGVYFPAPFAEALQADYPELEQVGRFNNVALFGAGSNEVRRLDRKESFHEEKIIYFDQSLLDILEIPFLQGNPENALHEPKTMVITERMAHKYFPDEDPIGKQIILNNNENILYQVTGVIGNPPTTSHLKYDFLISLSGNNFGSEELTNWRQNNYPTYVRVKPNTDIKQLEKKLSTSIEKYFLPAAIENGDTDDIVWVKSLTLELQPVDEIYLNLGHLNDTLPHGDIRYIWLFGAIAVFILLIASINFINLSTARSANRAREVGLRKVVGSLRSSLIAQFLSESLLFSFFSFGLGLVVAYLLLPYFNLLLGKSLIFPWTAWWLFPILFASALLVGCLAGLYPAFYLSSFQPVQVLKGQVSRGSKSSTTRNTLVIFQFTVSIVLIAGTFIIDRQINYVLTKKLGYDKEQVLVLQSTHTLEDKIATFKQELLRLPDVKQVAISSFLPVEGTKRNGNTFWKEGRRYLDQGIGGQRWTVDHDYIQTMGMKLIEGRNFSNNLSSDSEAIIINEAMAKALNLDDPIGEQIMNGRITWTVIGVVEDFHFESLKQSIAPLCLELGRSNDAVSVKIQTADMPGLISTVTDLWNGFSPNQSIRYTFLDESYARMYDEVARIKYFTTSFAVLAIIVACLGLFALSTFLIEQRSKEIGIRKVLGASVRSIVGLLSKDFLKMVMTSFLLAIPLAWYGMQQWLADFAYRIHLEWWMFALAGLLALVIAILTISSQSIKAGLANPVDALRNE